jgi:hypothetical protein
MMHQGDIWPCLVAGMSPPRWMTLHHIYTLVTTTIPLDREDLEAAGFGTNAPRWQRSVRSCLAHHQRQGDIEHGKRTMYRLTPQGARQPPPP